MNNQPRITPRRTYIISDTLGAYTDPTRSEDPDVQIAEDFNGLAWMVPQKRELNINGRTGIAPHLLRHIIHFHDQQQSLVGKDDAYTGVFVNHAERTEENAHGSPFFVAETDNNVRVVTTPIEVLSSVRDRVHKLWELPNEGNELFESGEQFRSQYTPALLPRDHGIRSLVERDPDIIPQGRNGSLHFEFADGFLNMILWQKHQEEIRQRLLERAHATDSSVGVSFNGSPQQEVLATTSLEAAHSGVLSIYPNGENIDIVGKWADGYETGDKIRKSAYWLFNQPEEGYTPVSFSW